eukprot:1578345-Prymnesium_polylepis.1
MVAFGGSPAVSSSSRGGGGGSLERRRLATNVGSHIMQPEYSVCGRGARSRASECPHRRAASARSRVKGYNTQRAGLLAEG